MSNQPETKTISVHGLECTVEKRFCAGGCGKEFWVFPESKAKHARSDCLYVCNVPINEIPEYIMKRFDSEYTLDVSRINVDDEKKRYAKQTLFNRSNVVSDEIKKNKREERKERKEKDIILKNARQSFRWNRAIERVKKIIKNKSKLPRYREIVAIIAKSVVTNKKNFSIKCFSSQAGLDRKTLQTWLCVKYDIINKIEGYDGNFLAARRTRDIVRKNNKQDISEIYQKEKEKCLQKKLEIKTSNQRKKQTQTNQKDILHLNKEDKSNGLSTTNSDGKMKTYRLKIKLKYVS
jgi:hypothetical protein